LHRRSHPKPEESPQQPTHALRLAASRVMLGGAV
jgi:hypothetical protein